MRRVLIIYTAALFAASCSGSSSPASPSTANSPTVSPAPQSQTPTAPTLPSRDPARFDQTFWNEFVHNAYDAPPGAEPLRRLTAAPMIALMTLDDAGHVIDDATLSSTESTLRDTAPQLTGGLFGVADVQRTMQSHRGQRGWLTVLWASAASGYCGLTDIGLDGGTMTLYPNTPNCGCPPSITASKIRPRTVAHELGHAFGYYHTDNVADLMHVPSSSCLQSPDERERYHAALAYQTPVGTTEALAIGRVVVID